MQIDVHPAAAIFPMLPEDELKQMAKSITAFGLREKIGVMTDEEQLDRVLVLDGRNRLEALRLVGVKDDVIVSEFTQVVDLSAYRATPEEYVLMANIERRNLTGGQRRALAGKLAVMLSEKQKHTPKEEQTDTLSKAAELAGVSRRTAATAKKQVLTDAGKINPPKTPSKKPAPGVAARTIINQLQGASEVVTKSGHNFEVEALEEIAQLTHAISNTARVRIQLVAERRAADAAAVAKKAADEAAAASGEEDSD
jgi:hypothetical protein